MPIQNWGKGIAKDLIICSVTTKQILQPWVDACLHHQFKFAVSSWILPFIFVGPKSPSEASLEEKRGAPFWFLKVKSSC